MAVCSSLDPISSPPDRQPAARQVAPVRAPAHTSSHWLFLPAPEHCILLEYRLFPPHHCHELTAHKCSCRDTTPPKSSHRYILYSRFSCPPHQQNSLSWCAPAPRRYCCSSSAVLLCLRVHHIPPLFSSALDSSWIALQPLSDSPGAMRARATLGDFVDPHLRFGIVALAFFFREEAFHEDGHSILKGRDIGVAMRSSRSWACCRNSPLPIAVAVLSMNTMLACRSVDDECLVVYGRTQECHLTSEHAQESFCA